MYKLQPIKKEIEIKGFNSIYYFEFGKDFTHSPEKHNFWEMVYVDSGKVLAITDGNSCTLSQGQMIFHEPGEIHSHISDSQTPNNMLVISFSCDSPSINFFAKNLTAVVAGAAHGEPPVAVLNESIPQNKGRLESLYSFFRADLLILITFCEFLLQEMDKGCKDI